jgi:hypothetical protein
MKTEIQYWRFSLTIALVVISLFHAIEVFRIYTWGFPPIHVFPPSDKFLVEPTHEQTRQYLVLIAVTGSIQLTLSWLTWKAWRARR